MQEPPAEATPATSRPASRTSPGGIVVVVAAIVAVIGVLLPWAKAGVSGALAQSGLDVSQSVSGLSTSDGKIFLALAIALVVVGVVALATGAGRWTGIAAIVLGVLAAAFAVYEIATLKSSFVDSVLKQVQQQAPVGTSQAILDRARAVIQQFIDRGAISIKAGVGLFLSAAGGVAAVLGGIMLLGERRGGTSSTETTEAGGGMAVGPAMGGFQGESPAVTPPAVTPPADPASPAEPIVTPTPPAPPAGEPSTPPPPPAEPQGDERPPGP